MPESKTPPAGLLLLISIAVYFSSSSVNAACKGMNCACKPSVIQFASPALEPNEDGKYPIALEADDVSAEGQNLVTLSGNAEVTQGRQTIVADLLKYYRESDRVVASGNVEMISADGHYLSSDSIDVHAPTQIGQLKNTEFKLARSISSEDGVDSVEIEARGSADVVNLEGEGLIRLENASYTNCAEGNDDVIIRAKQLELDQNAGIGKARNATVRFMNVPVFYLPYVSFPLNDERKTGLLTPGFGSDEESGNVIELPWYWNIAANQDATITPRLYTDRGLQIGAEYRHRSQNSSTFIYGEFLPDDDLFGEDRDLLSIQHTQSFTPNLTARVNYNDVSDADYFDDFRNDVRYFSATYVPRDVSLSYSGQYFNVRARANEYQIIDPIISAASKPYERRPSITFGTRLPDGPYGMQYGVAASYTDFASDTRIEGTRTALTPYVSLPFENIWGYVTPRLSLHHRQYSLDNVAAGQEDSPSFSVPIFSVNAGLYFEKNTNWFGDGALHTLEPRAFYAYAPDEDQSDVPIFDTSQVFLNNFGNIFRESRFYGEDRVGDTNQLTLGLTTRIIDNKSGDQRLKASFGQLILLDDLEQNLFPGQVIESGLGDLLAEVRTESKGPWTTYGFVQYDHDESEIRTARFALGYEPKDDARKNISVGYYFANGRTRDVDQLTLSAHWPLSDRWQLFADERYSIEDSESLSTTLGLEYNSCCWKLRISGQERIHNRDIEDKKTNIFVELELTSLGRVRTGIR
ncbi:MAG: LPS-assembly protein LptD [Gammaproteobacteria bacterium]|nr:LPS-assembly protein LptD [Gammaproteobacteria bacterium]